MNLRASIEERYKEAVKSKKLEKANALRLIKSAIKDKDIENRTSESNNEIDDNQIMTLLQNLIKQRKDSIESFKTASRDDLIVKEQLEIDLIIQFLPKQLNERETEEIIKEINDKITIFLKYPNIETANKIKNTEDDEGIMAFLSSGIEFIKDEETLH